MDNTTRWPQSKKVVVVVVVVVIVVVAAASVKLTSFNFIRYSDKLQSYISAARNTFFPMCFQVSAHTHSLCYCSWSRDSILCPCDTRYSHIRDFFFFIYISQLHHIPYPTAFPYGNGMVLHFYQQQESSTTKTVHKVINKGLKTYV